MRQICRELWVENCCLGLGAGKAGLLLFMVFGGLFLRDYPYSIICMLILTSLEITVMKMHGQIDYILPQTSREKKKNIIIKSVLVAGFYSTVNTVSYVWLVCRRADYHWDLEIVLFFVYMTVVLFLYFFSYRAGLFCVGSNQMTDRQEHQSKHEWVRDIWADSLASLLSIFTCLLYIIYRFGNISVPAVLVSHGREIMLVFGGITLVLTIRMAAGCIRGMDYSEYMEL